MSEINNLIIHNKCGLPVELCECTDSEVFYDSEEDVFVERKSPPIKDGPA